MLSLALGVDVEHALTVLCLGAHSDDIEIGAGATLLRLLAERPDTVVHWVVFSADDDREAEARASAASFLGASREGNVTVHHFRESYLPFVASDVKDAFEQLKGIEPDVVITHRREDEHQDHRTIGQLTWNTFRDHLVLEYEIPKYEGDLGHPNLFVPVDHATAARKIELLMQHFASQRSRTWFRESTFQALMALRGIECNAPDGFAEAFHVRKLVL